MRVSFETKEKERSRAEQAEKREQYYAEKARKHIVNKEAMNLTPADCELKEGQRVDAMGRNGVVRFVGTTNFQPGLWVGIELDGPDGKTDGTVKGISYFRCEPNH